MKEKVKKLMQSKRFWRGICLAAAIVSGLQLVLEAGIRLMAAAQLFQFQWDRGSAASVGIIGGADGPTAIFLTTSTGPFTETMAAVLVFVIAVFCYIRLRRQK